MIADVVPAFLMATGVTACVAGASILIGGVLAGGLVVCLRARNKVLARICASTVAIIRGVPVLTMLLFAYYGLPSLIGVFPGPVVTAIGVLSLHFAVFACEVLRAAVEDASKTLLEQGVVLGMSRWGIWRWLILPDMVQRAAPGVVALAIGLVKYSSLTSVIAVPEIMRQAELLALESSRPLQAYFLAGACYVILITPLSILGRLAEDRCAGLTRGSNDATA